MSRNMRTFGHKVPNGQNLPHESPNFTNYFFQSNIMHNLGLFNHITKTVFFLNNFFLFSAVNSRMSRNMCIWCHKLCNAKTGDGPTFTWSNER